MTIPHLHDYEVAIIDKFGNVFVACVESVYREAPEARWDAHFIREPQMKISLTLRMSDPRHIIVSEETCIKEPKQITA